MTDPPEIGMAEILPARSPELDLCVRIACVDWRTSATRNWAGVFDRPVDWRRFRWLAHRHQIRPMVALALKESGWPGGSAAIRDDIEGAGQTRTLAAMGQLEMLCRVRRAAAAAGVRMMALKGGALSMQLYGTPCIRESFDSDILVSQDDLGAIDRILTREGFLSQLRPHSERQARLVESFHKDRRYYHPGRRLWLDCHWRVTASRHLLPLSFDEAWQSRDEVAVGGVAVPVLSGIPLMLYLGCHGSWHKWTRVKWLGDMAALASRMGPAEFSGLRRGAEAVGLGDLLGSWLILLAGMAGVAVPGAELAWAMSRPRSRRLAAGGVDGAALRTIDEVTGADLPMARTRVTLYAMGLKRDWRYLADFLLHAAHRQEDWQKFNLPDAAIPLYYILRPVVWACRRLIGS